MTEPLRTPDKFPVWILILTRVEVRFNALLHYSRTDMPSRIPRPLSPACGLHLLGSIAPGDAACRDGGGGQLEMITAAKVHPLCSKSRDRGRAESQTRYIGAPEHYAQQNAVTAKREKRYNRPACTLPRPLGLVSRDSV